MLRARATFWDVPIDKDFRLFDEHAVLEHDRRCTLKSLLFGLRLRL